VFGSRARLAEKWAAAARVVSDPKAAGAAYVDVRIPERPVAGPFTSSSGVDDAQQAGLRGTPTQSQQPSGADPEADAVGAAAQAGSPVGAAGPAPTADSAPDSALSNP
jgi:hypothetical protein